MNEIDKYYFNKKALEKSFNLNNSYGSVCYTMKTNSSNELIFTLKPLMKINENYFLISSKAHYEKLKNFDIASNQMSLINILASIEDIKFLYENGVRFFTFDNSNTLMQFLTFADDKTCKINIRLNLNDIFGFCSPHGGSVAEVFKLIELIKNKFDDFGISFYIPHKYKNSKNALKKTLSYIKKHFSSCNFKFASLAGLTELAEHEKNIINQFKKALSLKTIHLELGQNISNSVYTLKTQVKRFKNDRQKVLIISRGIFSGFFDCTLYKKKFEFCFYLDKQKIKLQHKYTFGSVKIKIFGGSGDNDDFLGNYYIKKEYLKELENLREIYVENVGAYFEEFNTPHGNALANETIIQEENTDYPRQNEEKQSLKNKEIL